MSRTARRTAETAAIALIIATGAAGGVVAASLAAQDADAAAPVITPAAEDRFVPPAQVPSWTPPDASTQTAPQPRAGVPVVPRAPHTSRSS